MNKYRNIKTIVDNFEFDSKKEAGRFRELRLLERAGKIRNLEIEPHFPFFLEGEKIFSYRADFAYFENDKRVIEDVKGFRTPVYRLKKKLIEKQCKVQIREI